MVDSKMAASLWNRCVRAFVKVKRFSPSLSVRRCLLSASYTDSQLWEARVKDPANMAVLANNMDRTYDKNLPVSSLAMSRFVDNISSREEVDQAEYYLYKFRHSPNCWYLRDWTIHGWIRQCLKYGAKEKALHTVKNKVQYGIFPDNFTFNLLMDSFIKDKDFKSACSVVEAVMLQEAFDLHSTQILSMYALGCYLATKPQLTLLEERSLGASLLISTNAQSATIEVSAQLLGNALLGKVEVTKGIHGVFKGMPLSWEQGYLERALAVMERVATASGDVKLCKESLDYVNYLLEQLSSASDTPLSGEESGAEEEEKDNAVDEDDQAEKAKLPQYDNRFKVLRCKLENQNKVDSSSFLALVIAKAQQNLPAAEKSDLKQYEVRLQAWEAEKKLLMQREKDMKEKAEHERKERLAARAAAQQV